MKPEAADSTKMIETLEAIRQDLARLTERVTALEALGRSERRDADGKAVPEAHKSTTPVVANLSEELILIISAAVAAYLGKKPHIQQIRLIGTTAWAQQGRVTVQASHALAARQTRRDH